MRETYHAPLKIASDAAQALDQPAFLGAKPRGEAMIASVMARARRDGRERVLIDAEHPTQSADRVNGGHRPAMPYRIVQAKAGPALNFGVIEVSDPSAAPWAFKPWPPLVVPQDLNFVPVD